MRRDVAHALLPLVEDEGWFFDTELLVLAEHNGLRIHEVPVDWVDDPVSRVDILRTAAADLRGVGRLLQRFARVTVSSRRGPPARPSTTGSSTRSYGSRRSAWSAPWCSRCCSRCSTSPWA